jgi:hypothetical protein
MMLQSHGGLILASFPVDPVARLSFSNVRISGFMIHDPTPSELRRDMSPSRVREPAVGGVRNISDRGAISGTDVAGALDACHIWVRSKNGINNSKNGIFLRADLYRLFDKGLMGIDAKTMKVVVWPELMTTEYGEFHGVKLAARGDDGCDTRRYPKWGTPELILPPSALSRMERSPAPRCLLGHRAANSGFDPVSTGITRGD